jgi:hypothetical protein
MTMHSDIPAPDWPRLSAMLDALLDAPAAEQAARLAQIEAQAPADAQALRQLLAHHDAAERDDFLGTRSSPAMAKRANAQAQRFGPWQALSLLACTPRRRPF